MNIIQNRVFTMIRYAEMKVGLMNYELDRIHHPENLEDEIDDNQLGL